MIDAAELLDIARHEGIRDLEYFRTEKQLVWAIQRARGKAACFLSEDRMKCKDLECQWRRECLKLVAEWRR